MQELANKTVLSFDPLPPSDAIDLYDEATRRRAVAGGAASRDESMLGVFLRYEIRNQKFIVVDI